MPLAFVVFVLVGVLLYWVLVPRLQGSVNPEMLSIILFFGLFAGDRGDHDDFRRYQRAFDSGADCSARCLRPSRSNGLGGKPGGAGPIFILGQGFPAPWVIAAITSLIAIACVYFYLYRTRLGTLTRAVMSQRDEALATGIDVDRVSAAAFGIGLGLAAVAGVFAPFMFGSVTPAFGGDATVTSFAIVVLGSLGNPLGTALGGVVYGVLLHDGADLSQFMGGSVAICSFDFHPSAAPERAVGKAGARCLAPSSI